MQVSQLLCTKLLPPKNKPRPRGNRVKCAQLPSELVTPKYGKLWCSVRSQCHQVIPSRNCSDRSQWRSPYNRRLSAWARVVLIFASYHMPEVSKTKWLILNSELNIQNGRLLILDIVFCFVMCLEKCLFGPLGHAFKLFVLSQECVFMWIGLCVKVVLFLFWGLLKVKLGFVLVVDFLSGSHNMLYMLYNIQGCSNWTQKFLLKTRVCKVSFLHLFGKDLPLLLVCVSVCRRYNLRQSHWRYQISPQKTAQISCFSSHNEFWSEVQLWCQQGCHCSCGYLHQRFDRNFDTNCSVDSFGQLGNGHLHLPMKDKFLEVQIDLWSVVAVSCVSVSSEFRIFCPPISHCHWRLSCD